MSKPARIFTAKFAGQCERCLGRIDKGQAITSCAGVHNAYQHAASADCRDAFRADQRRRMNEAVSMGIITVEQADAAIGRDDAAARFADEVRAA